MSEEHDSALQAIKLCSCPLCEYKTDQFRSCEPSDVGTSNSMASFIKMLPLGFPLIIEQTIILHRREDNCLEYHSYSNPVQEERKAMFSTKRKYNIIHQTFKSLNSLTCQNIQLYFASSERIMTKFEATSLIANSKGDEVLYVQPYQHNPIIRIEYPSHLENKLDNILKEYLAKEVERYRGENYKFNEEFLEWVFREYGEELFFYFLTELCARIIKVITRGEIKSAVFFWIAERSLKDILTVQKKGAEREKYNSMQEMGRPQRLNFRPKLVNVRDFIVQKIEKLYSFDEEYQSLIKQRIANSTKKTITAIKNKAYRGRLDVFRSKIQDVYKQEQREIIDGIEEEKQFQYQVDTQKMAHLLIPTLGPDQNFRQVLNDEKAFREVFLSKKKDRTFATLPALTRTGFAHRKSVKKNPEKHDPTVSRIKRRYEKLLTTPSTHE